MERYKYTLPVEHWRQVLVNISLGDLCNVVLTSKHMNRVASLPELWAGMKINRRKLRENGLIEFYNINRFRKVKQINLRWNPNKDFEFMRDIPGSPLENLDLGHQDLSGVSAEVLARAVSHLHIVNLEETRLTTDQVVGLLKASLSSTTLRTINLYSVCLKEVPTGLLANSISRLEDVNLCSTGIATDQIVSLLKASLSSTTLRNVNLVRIDLRKVPAELLANSISRLEDINLCSTGITTDQTFVLLKASLSSTTLRNVNLVGIDLSKVPADLLANSVSRLQDVDLRLTRLGTYQIVSLLKASRSSTTLRRLDLGCNGITKNLPDDLQYLVDSLPAHVRIKT